MAVEGTEVERHRTRSSTPAASDEVAFCGRAGPGGGGLRTSRTAADRETGDGTDRRAASSTW